MRQSASKSTDHATTLKRLRSLSHILDNAIAIPGTSIRFGIDPIIGLLPIAGDYLGFVLSAYIVLQAGLMGLPKQTLIRMVLNIVFDALIGCVPALGDLFDFAFKANSKNVALLESHIAEPHPSKKADKRFLFLLLGGLLLVFLGITAMSVFILSLLFKAIRG